jgi:UMF1 family MFS transporter
LGLGHWDLVGVSVASVALISHNISVVEAQSYRKIVNSWAMYDWANSAFVTTIVAAVFPPYYRSLVRASGLSEADATAYWAYTTSIALIVVASIGPVLGAASDHSGGKKKYIAGLAALGIISTVFLIFLGEDSYLWASLLFILASVGYGGGNIFYESLLPLIARRGDIDQISARGYALGYVGGGILLVVNALWLTFPEAFAFGSMGTALKACFLSVSVWWAVFSIPLFRNVPEPAVGDHRMPGPAISAAFGRLRDTFREIRRYRQLLLFLVAFWIYNDGIGTIIKMATAYGDEIGIPTGDMVIALVITQFVGIPCAFGFGALARRIGAKRSILIGLCVYVVITTAAYFMRTVTHFYILAFGVGLVQGGSQALSRSLFGAMVPKDRAAEFFGFFSTSEKVAGICGPLLFGLASQLFGGSRISILSVIVFFVVGGLLLSRVNVEEGIRAARS